MFIKYLKSKLGINDLESEIALLKKESAIEQSIISKKIAFVSSELNVLRNIVNSKIDATESTKLTSAEIVKLEKEIELIANVFTEEFVSQIEKLNSKIYQSKKEFDEQYVSDHELVRKQIADLLAEIKTYKDEIQKVESKTPLPPIQIISLQPKVIKEFRGPSYSVDVLDNNYLRALLKNEIPFAYNSSEIKRIPDNYTLTTESNFRHLSGYQNRHCYDNALLYGKQTKYIIHIGIIFPKLLLQKMFEAKEGITTITPYLHAWNVTELGKIADYTLGNKRGEEFIYVGRPLIDNVDNLTAKDVEEILRNETINNK